MEKIKHIDGDEITMTEQEYNQIICEQYNIGFEAGCKHEKSNALQLIKDILKFI